MGMRLKLALLSACVAALGVLGQPGVARAQSAITGVIKDTSGAVLPGVTVEAASDALIERTRSVVTDGEGVYRIVDLRPGVYIVTFSLEGFAPVRRDAIELPSEFTMTLNAELKVGSLEESITVSGAAPVVDVSTAVHTQVLNREAIDNIPTGRTIQGVGQLVVGINLNLPDTGGARAMQQTYMSAHGMTSSNNTVLVDGLIVNGLQSDGSVQSYFNDAMNQEVSYQTSGISADTSAGGVRLNMIPREGGNRFAGSFATAYRPGDWQGSNLTDRHVAAGLTAGNHTDRIIDFTYAQGGPIRKDKVWFFASARYFSVNNFIANTFFDDGSQGVDDQFIKSAMARVTWQVSPRNKFTAYFDEVDKYRGHDMQSGDDPETAATVWYSPAYHTTAAKWTSTVTSRLLVDAGFSSNLEYYTNSYQEGIEQPRGTAAWFASASRLEQQLSSSRTMAATSQSTQSPARYNVQSSASYVTGSHNFKAGFQYQWGTFYHTVDANADLTQQYRSLAAGRNFATPDTVMIRNTPLAKYGERLNHDIGLYAQDAWTLKRLTVNVGIRWEAINAQVEAAETPAGRFVPARSFGVIENLPDWQDWAPRFAVVYDLFGNARTALKYSANRYNQARTTGIASNYNPLLSQTFNLTWRDVNGDDIAQGERGCTGYPQVGCEINVAQIPANFGIAALNEYGAYPRTWNLEHGLELQHELLPGLSLTGSWFHGAFHNLTATVDRNLTFADYTPLTVYDVVTGEPFTVYNRTAASNGRATSNLDTFDPERKRVYNAFNVEFKARFGRGGQVFGGTSFERQRDKNCTAPDNPNMLIHCDEFAEDIPFRKGLKVAGSYPLPYGITFSASLQSNASPAATGATEAGRIAATRNMTITRAARYPAGCPSPCPAQQLVAPTLTLASLAVPILPSNASFIERITQLDLKVSKSFQLGRVTFAPQLEVFNVNNSDAIISYQSLNALNASYGKPNSIMQPRMLGIGANVRW
jgi:hypothetical protein